MTRASQSGLSMWWSLNAPQTASDHFDVYREKLFAA
jgi:hypothetical protein